MAQQAKRRGPKPWVVKRTEVLHSGESVRDMGEWQMFSGEQEDGASMRRALAVLRALSNKGPGMQRHIRKALEETKP